MTSALKAMIDAMAAEIVRQTDDQIYRGDDPKFVHIGIYAARYGNGENNGRIDLEKVARAALKAIREPGDEVDAGVNLADLAADPFVGTDDEGIPADPADAREAWTYIIDEILKDQP